MSNSKNTSSNQKSSKGESGDGSFWDNNGGAIMSATSSVLHAGYRTTRYVAKAGYKASKNHYEHSKNKRNGVEKSDSNESLETVHSPPMGASQDVKNFQPPPLRAGQKQYQPGGVVVDAGTTPIANLSPVPAANAYPGVPQQGYPTAGYAQANGQQPPVGGAQNFAPQVAPTSSQVFQPLYGPDGQIIGYVPMQNQVGAVQPPAPPVQPAQPFGQPELNQQPQQYQQPQAAESQYQQPQVMQQQIPQQQQYVHPTQRPHQPSPEQQQPGLLPARAQPAPPPTAPRPAAQVPGLNPAGMIAAQQVSPEVGQVTSTNPQPVDEGELSAQNSNGPVYKVKPYEFMDPEERAEAKRIELKTVDISNLAPPPTHAGRKAVTGPKFSQLVEDKQSGRISSEEFNSRSGSLSTGPVKKLGRSTTNSSWNSSHSSINVSEPKVSQQLKPASSYNSGIENNVARMTFAEPEPSVEPAPSVGVDAVPPPPYSLENSSKPLSPDPTDGSGNPSLNSHRTAVPPPPVAPSRNSTLSIKTQRTFSPNASSTNVESSAENRATVLKGNYDYQKPVNFAPPPRPHRNAQDLENEEAKKNRITANKYSRMAASSSSSHTPRTSAPQQPPRRVLQNAAPEPIVNTPEPISNTPSTPSTNLPQPNLPARASFPPPPKRVTQSSDVADYPNVAQTPLGISKEADMFPKVSRFSSRPQFPLPGRSDDLSTVSIPSNSPKAGPPVIKPKPDALKGKPPAKPFKPTYLTDRSESSINESAGVANIDYAELAKNKAKKKAPPPKPKKKPTLNGIVSSMEQTNGTHVSNNADDDNPFSIYSKGSVPAELDHLQHRR
ncbi:hypothetical protein ACO0QE_003281 [Hanseniaspora vineae]